MAYTVHKRSGDVNVVFRNPAASHNPEIEDKPGKATFDVKKSCNKKVIICVSIIVMILLIGLPILVWQIMERSKCLILIWSSYIHLFARAVIAVDGYGE